MYIGSFGIASWKLSVAIMLPRLMLVLIEGRYPRMGFTCVSNTYSLFRFILDVLYGNLGNLLTFFTWVRVFFEKVDAMV